MTITSDYEYRSPETGCAHNYLLPIISKLLSTRGAKTRILDLGCGNGAVLGTIGRREWELEGVDASLSGIAIAQRAYPGISFRVGDVTSDFEKLGPAAEYFDVVLSTEVIEHVYAPRQLAANAYKALRPGGEFIVTTPYHGYLKNLILALSGKLDAHFTALWDGGHIKFWSRQTITAVLSEAGFSRFRFYGAGRFPFLWKSMIVVAEKPVNVRSVQTRA